MKGIAELSSLIEQALVIPVFEEKDYCSTQINLPEEVSDEVRQWQKGNMMVEYLSEKGMEDKPHITVKYGLHETKPSKELIEAIAQYQPFHITLGPISMFKMRPENESASDNYDVVKVGIESPELVKLNEHICKLCPHVDTFAKYSPHMTLAYVKPGSHDKLEGCGDMKGWSFPVNEILFSNLDRTKISMPLKEKY